MLKYLNRLAITNLKKNHRLYLPYGIVVTIVIAFTYIFTSLTLNDRLLEFRGGSAINSVLNLGIWVVFLVAAAILFYGNNFTVKNRMREFGLYRILGVEKQHLLLMTAIELIFFAVITIGSGVVLGIIFDQLSYAILQYLMKLPVELVSTFRWATVAKVAGGFLIAYIGLIIFNGIKMLRLKPMAILKEARAGEQKARFTGIIALIGFIILGAGYYLANTVEHPVSAIGTFFMAVMLVIIGTFLLFRSGIILILKLLKRNPHYYYQSTRMISISNLIFRMRQNAMGLATICILSTMTLVVVVGVTCLYVGSERMIDLQYPYDLNVTIEGQLSEKEMLNEKLSDQINQLIDEKKLQVNGHTDYQLLNTFALFEGNHLNLNQNDDNFQSVLSSNSIQVIDQSVYQQLFEETIDLKMDEIMVFQTKELLDPTQPLVIGTKEFILKEVIKDKSIIGKLPLDFMYLNDQYTLFVVNDLNHFMQGIESEAFEFLIGRGIQLSHSFEEQVNLLHANEMLGENLYYSGKANYASDFYQINGAALFVGILLSVLFAIGMILTMYFKQMTEGFEDQKRFVTLHQLGLDKLLINKAIRYQVLTVFLLPIILAVIHMVFAYKTLGMIMMLISGINHSMMLPIVVGTTSLFILFYLIVYVITAHNYRRIVADIR